MSTMGPLGHRRSAPEMPVLSSSEERDLVDQFLEHVRRELTIAGRFDNTAIAKLEAMRERVLVNPKLSGIHEVRYRSPHRGPINVSQTVKEVLEKLDERATLLALGPDPVDLLVDRLKALGVTDGEARRRAAGRVHRMGDGRVAAPGLYAGGPPPMQHRVYTASQLEELRSPEEAVSRAARAILAEIAAGASGTPEGDHDSMRRIISQVDNDHTRIRAKVAGSF